MEKPFIKIYNGQAPAQPCELQQRLLKLSKTKVVSANVVSANVAETEQN
jgi:hypothetical protein